MLQVKKQRDHNHPDPGYGHPGHGPRAAVRASGPQPKGGSMKKLMIIAALLMLAGAAAGCIADPAAAQVSVGSASALAFQPSTSESAFPFQNLSWYRDTRSTTLRKRKRTCSSTTASTGSSGMTPGTQAPGTTGPG